MNSSLFFRKAVLQLRVSVAALKRWKAPVKKLFYFILFTIIFLGVTSINAQTPTGNSVTVAAAADATVRSDQYASINYGTDTTLIVKGTTISGYARYAYLKFALSAITDKVTSAKLRIYGQNTENSTGISTSVYGVNDDNWTETGITWSKAPAGSGSALSSVGVTNTATYYELDVTAFIQAQVAADQVASLVVKNASNQNKNLRFSSRENSANPPQLVITTEPAGTNHAPVLDNIGTKDAIVGQALTFTASATETDQGQTKTFSLINDANGGSIDAITGAFSWTPTATGTFNFTIRVTDDGSPALFDEEQIAVNVTEAGAPGSPLTITPVADAFVRSNSYAGINYGLNPTLAVKGSTKSGYTRISYLKFALNTITGTIRSAKLRLYGRNTETATSITLSAFGVTNDNWTETGITWSNAPAGSGSVLSSVGVNNQGSYHELDVTRFVQAQLSGDQIASFLLKNPTNQGSFLEFNSRENSANPPQLVITTEAPGTNHAPVLDSIGNKDVIVGQALTFTASAIDTDQGQTKTFSLTNDANGASIDNATGAFSWTPTATGTFNFTIRVTDNGSPALFDEEQITVVVSNPFTGASVTLAPTADAFVRNGSYAAINYGTDPALVIRGSTTSGYARFSYLKFSLGSITRTVTAARLRIYGRNTESTAGITTSIFGISNDAWTESGITWNNAPASTGAALNSVAINDQAGYYELDVTGFVQAQLAGDKTASFVIKNPSNQSKFLEFSSRENSLNPPQLVLSTDPTFTTSVQTDIPNPGTATVPITVSGLPDHIDTTTFGLQSVQVKITHPNLKELTLQLQSPDGKIIYLSRKSPGINYNSTFDAVADKFVDINEILNSYTGSYTGNYRPRQDLALLNNFQNPNGVWNLIVKDDTTASAAGVVTGVSLVFGNKPAQPLLSSSNLPIVKIYTENGVDIPDDPKVVGDIYIINNGAGAYNYANQTAYEYQGKIGIEIRGNTTATKSIIPKKQYGFETRAADGITGVNVSLFGMPSQGDWILSAVMSDKSLLRNVLTYQLARDMGYWASRTKYCEVIINDEYRGVFIFEEKIKRDKNRVNIEKLATTDITAPNVTGGYIFSIDDTDETSVTWQTKIAPKFSPFQFVYPKPADLQPAQRDYLQAYVDSFETALHGADFQNPEIGFRKYANDRSFMDFFLLNEFAKNSDAYRASTYFYKARGGKIVAGPIWDFDRGFRNDEFCNSYSPEGYIYKDVNTCSKVVPWWWARLLEDTKYKADLVCRYNNLRQANWSKDHLNFIIDSSAAVLNAGAQQRNFIRWAILGKFIDRNHAPYPATYSAEIDTLKNWISARLNWLDSDLGPCAPTPLTKNQSNNLNGAIMDQENSVAVYPSPFRNQLTIRLNLSRAQRVMIQLVDANSKHFYQKTYSLQKGVQQVRIELGTTQLASGLYLMQIKGLDINFTKKVLKE